MLCGFLWRDDGDIFLGKPKVCQRRTLTLGIKK